MFWTVIRSVARAGVGIITFPISLTIDRHIFKKNGPNIGTIMLLFIFVNCYWLLPILAVVLEGIIPLFNPSLKGLGKETASIILIFIGTYFYWLPIGCMVCLVYFSIMKRKHPKFIYIIYKILEYLMVITPVSAAVYTLFSFHILYAFQYVPHGNGSSFFQPDNFYHFAAVNFPFLKASWNFKNPAIYFSFYGILAGMISSTRLWLNEISSGRRLYKDSVNAALSKSPEKNGYLGLAVIYASVIFWQVMLPVFTRPVSDFREIIIRSGCFVFLLLPLFFHAALLVYRKTRAH